MDKPYYKSWTFWGVLFLSIEATLKWTYWGGIGLYLLNTNIPIIEPVFVFFGTLLTVFGFRRAMK